LSIWKVRTSTAAPEPSYTTCMAITFNR